MQTFQRMLILGTLLSVYYVVAGKTAWSTAFGREIGFWFAVGAIVALWGGRVRIGIIHPVSLRTIFVCLGALLMLLTFILMLTSRDFAGRLGRIANEGAPGNSRPAAELTGL